jgi:hypothetical protein
MNEAATRGGLSGDERLGRVKGIPDSIPTRDTGKRIGRTRIARWGGLRIQPFATRAAGEAISIYTARNFVELVQI